MIFGLVSGENLYQHKLWKQIGKEALELLSCT